MAKWGSGGGRKPQSKTRHSKQSVLLTAESFSIHTVQCNGVQEVKLFLGPKSENYGVLKWIAHCDFNEPRQISITHEPDGKWFVGFGFQAKEWIPAPQLPRTLSEVLGNDRGVVNPVTDSTGRFYDFTETEKTKLVRRDKKRTDLQVKLTRQQQRFPAPRENQEENRRHSRKRPATADRRRPPDLQSSGRASGGTWMCGDRF